MAAPFFLAFAAAFGGYAALAVAAATTAAYHLLQGNISVPQIVQPMIVSGLLGLSWRWTIKARFGLGIWSLIGLGIWISLVTLLLLVLSKSDGWASLLTIYPIVLGVCVAASLILGKLIEREVRHFDDEEAWRRESLTDVLTELPNRRLFQADYHASSISQESFSLIVLDVDHFKAVNDTFGHPVGDEVLKRIAFVLKRNLPSGAKVYRLGGEEFAILLRGCEQARARRVAEEARRRIAEPLRAEWGAQPSVTISAGVATADRGSADKDIVAAADAALYYAKASGRNRVIGWDDLRKDHAYENPVISAVSGEAQTGADSNVLKFPR